MALRRKQDERFLRRHQMKFLFNDLELEAFEKYCRKYKIKNKAKFMRETVITEILAQFDRDYPSLFDQNEDTELV